MASHLELLRNPNKSITITHQADHIKRHNALGRVMASMGDIYRAGKDADEELLESLQNDFNENLLISSTRIVYQKESLQATIIDYWNSTVVAPQERRVIVPVYSFVPAYSSRTCLEEMLDTEEGAAYLQVLLNTTDDPQQIKKTMQRISKKSSRDTKVWTPNSNDRNHLKKQAGFQYIYGDMNNLEMAAGFDYNFGSFLIYTESIIIPGRSRGWIQREVRNTNN